MQRPLQAGNYRAACDALQLYRFSGGYDCSAPASRTCTGVRDRQMAPQEVHG